MELQVYQVDGSGTGRTVSLDASVFGVEPNDHVLWLDVRRIQGSARQGTHKVKERGENAHSTRKLYRQKGTGMSRAGSARSPLRRGGGTIFGPRPRSYGLKLTKKTRRLARRSALTYKARDEALRVVDSLVFDQPSTRQLVDLIRDMDLEGRKVLLLTAANQHDLYQSSRNLAKVAVQEVRNASTFDLLSAQVVVLEEGALDVLSQTLGGELVAGDGAPDPEIEAVVAEAVEAAQEEAVAEAEEAVEAAADDVAEAEEAVEAAADDVAEAEEAVEAAADDVAEAESDDTADDEDKEAGA